jgi:amino acid adenylation domain-containing protein/non-ribosomal peptide synthase protein (TIGR01720 family)
MRSSHTLLTDGAHDDHIAFWTSVLGTITDDFHVRQPWLSQPAGDGDIATVSCPLAQGTVALIDDRGRGQDTGVLAVVVAAASYLLHLHARATVVAIDSPPLAGDADDEPASDLLPLVTTVDGAVSVRDFLTAVSRTVGGSYTYQSLPVTELAQVVLKRARPRTNVFIAFRGLHAETGAGDHDLQIRLSRNPGITIELIGRAPAFSRAYLERLARHLAHVLEGFRDLSRRLDDIDVMGDEERQRVLVDYNAAGRGEVRDGTIHESFEQQAARAGSQVAIQMHDAAMTYDTLNRRANQLARVLRDDYGLQPGEVVGVVTHRSPLTIAGLLGVLKAGGVYLPIDADYPEDRLQFMVADAGVKVLLVHSEHIERLVSLYETPMFALDIQLETLTNADDDLGPIAGPRDPAYIIYTSGSTGQPKAVLLEHRGFVVMARHHIEAFGVAPSDRLLQFYGLSFDSSLFEVFVSLLSGARLVMVDRDTINDPARLSAYIKDQGITTLTLPPVYLSTLDHACLAGVTRYISAGDHCRVEDAVQLARASAYYNSYGPTETTVCVTHYRVDPARPYGSRIPIGTPITGTSIYLVDDRLRPVPEGVVGEIAVGGAGVARGYLHRDELTAEKFVASPFAAGERVYLTGDLGVWLPDGNLEVIGRKDNQVKVRGYRVELGEIEAVIDQHPQVKESAVVAREDDHGNKRLAAYVTASGTLDIADLKTLLRARLPEFMMPSAFVVLDTMPLTANGKIDRKALPAPVDAAPAGDPTGGEPENAVQATLVRIWQDVLGVPRVGIHDNLFDLGGDSILIIQIVSRAREEGLKLTPNQLFDHQTVAALSEVAEAVQPVAQAEQGMIEGAAPLAPMQAWFFEQRFADAHQFNQSVCLEVPPGGIDRTAAADATMALLAHHDALRLRFHERDGRRTADFGPLPDAPPFRVVDLGGTPAAEADDGLHHAIMAAQSSFDLATGPLMAVTLFLRGDQPARLLFVAHHLVVDGVSWRILLGDFSTAYAQRLRGDAVALPSKTLSFRAWTTALEDLADGAARSAEAQYWLMERAAVAPLPVDRPRQTGANIVASAREVTRTLDADTTTALLQDVPRAYTTEINDVLLAGLALTLQAWTGHDDVLIDLEAHGREELVDGADTSRTVGWFTAQFPVHLRIGAGDTPGDTIKSVKEQLRAVPRRGAGFGVLRYLSRDGEIVGRLKAQPAPEILFNYFGQAGRVLAPELSWALLPGPTGGDISPRAVRPHLLEINGMITDGRLAITWTFSEALHDRQTIEDLASRYDSALRLLVDHCRSTTTRQYTPSDFPAAGLDQKSLDALIAKIGR